MKSKKIVKAVPPPHHHLGREVVSIVLLAVSVFLLLCLASYSPSDPAWSIENSSSQLVNLGGRVGAFVADILVTFLGPSAFFLAAGFMFLALAGFRLCRLSWSWLQFWGWLLFIIVVPLLGSLLWPELSIWGKRIAFGGFIGNGLATYLMGYFSQWGSLLLSSVAFLISLLLLTNVSFGNILRRTSSTVPRFMLSIGGWMSSNLSLFYGRLQKAYRGRRKRISFSTLFKNTYLKSVAVVNWPIRRLKTALQKPKPPQSAPISPIISLTAEEKPLKRLPKPQPVLGLSPPPPPTPLESSFSPAVKIFKRKEDEHKKKVDRDAQLNFLPPLDAGQYTLPPLSLLDTPQERPVPINEQSLKANAQLLESKLRDFAVDGTVTEIHPGPVITMYEFVPAPGVKISKIVNLADDLSLAIGGRQVRIVAPLPDKAAVGLEIPNIDRETVWFRDILAHPKFKAEKSKLLFALGKDISGECFVTDLTKMPHLLVAGATGAGKSVSVNTMILSLLYQATPEDVRFIMVDPKMLELSVYQGIPHLLLPVVTDPKKAAKALRWAVKEMERRYQLMADLNTRNVINYNKRIEKGEHLAHKSFVVDGREIMHDGKFPYIVIIIDELADLMMVAGKEVEECITRLAQMARAAGIHLILATQRPSVDVLTGVIKANFPARISFKVSSRYDARTILDSIGSEQLLGAGDMLFLPPGSSRLSRVHGAFVSENEIGRVVDFLKRQGEPDYREDEILAAGDENAGMEDAGGFDDDLYDAAVAVVSETRQASISMVQRRLRIGYNRAARLIERMEAEGIVSRPNGSKGREVLVGDAR